MQLLTKDVKNLSNPLKQPLESTLKAEQATSSPKLLQQAQSPTQHPASTTHKALEQTKLLLNLVRPPPSSDSTRNPAAANPSYPNTQMSAQSSPNLYAVELHIGRQKLLTLSSALLNINQKVQVTVSQDGQLRISENHLKRPPLDQGKNVNAAATNTDKTNPLLTPTNTNSATAQATLKNGLKLHLPNQESTTKVLTQLSKLLETLSTARVTRDAIIPEKANKLIQQIVKHVVDTASSKTVESLITKSGFFLEGKLAETMRLPTQNIADNSYQRPKYGSTSSQTNTDMAYTRQTTDIPQTDLKALLIQLSSVLDKEHQSLITVIPNTQPQPSNITNASPSIELSKLFDTLLKLFGRSTTAGQSTASKKTELLQALQSAAASALSKISLSQIQKLISAAQDGTSTNGGTFELSLKIGDSIYPLTLSLSEEWRHVEEKDREHKTDEQHINKSQQWRLFMEFDLDGSGWVSCELTVCDHEVKTKIWAEKDVIRHSIQTHLHELQTAMEEDGISVEKLECLDGVPPPVKQTLSQSLVDITT